MVDFPEIVKPGKNHWSGRYSETAKMKRASLLFVILNTRHQSGHCVSGTGAPGFTKTFFCNRFSP